MSAVQANPNTETPAVAPQSLPFIDQHFTKIAFAVSTLVLLIFQPGSLFLGALAGLFLQYTFEPNPVIEDSEKVITVSHATFAIIAAVAAVIQITPSGAMGGYLFQSLPFLFSTAIGSAAFCGFTYFSKPSQ